MRLAKGEVYLSRRGDRGPALVEIGATVRVAQRRQNTNCANGLGNEFRTLWQVTRDGLFFQHIKTREL